MASRWGRRAGISALFALVTPAFFRSILSPPVALAEDDAPTITTPPPEEFLDPAPACGELSQGPRVHVLDTRSIAGPTTYVSDHTFVQGPRGEWHLFGIFHEEPMNAEAEVDFVHAIAREPDPGKWGDSAFEAVEAPYRVALHAKAAIGETHIWAPHVVKVEGRYAMVYQSGGPDDDHAGIRLAESDDLYRWTRVGDSPLFTDICVARDPMLVRREGAWALHYTRCDDETGRHSGVAYRLSHDLVHWSEPRMALALGRSPARVDSGNTESPFVFEHGGFHWLSVSDYPLAWDATLLYRSSVPSSFPDVPYARLRARAGEWLTGAHGELFVTHAGPGQRGIWMSRVEGL